jgi:RNA polymerase sigma-70 factor (ECF subfamily)
MPGNMPESEAQVAISDEQAALLVQNGDKDKFGLLMDRYKARLFRYGRKFLANEDNIDDVVQDVFIKAYQNIRSFDVSQKFSPWIYRIAHNTYINAIKKISRGPIYTFDFDTIAFDTIVSHPVYEDPLIKETEEVEMKKMVEKGLDTLSSNYREIVILYYTEELSYKEIADILRIPIGTVGIRLKRAKEALKKGFLEESAKRETEKVGKEEKIKNKKNE